MANTLKIKRGTAATIPQGQLAEPLFTTDTYDLYIGKGSGGNQRIQNYIASGTSSQFLKGDGSLDSTTYQATSEKGQNNGYASLDSGGKVPASQLPNSIMDYLGTWDASTNTPTLADGTGNAGDVYICSVGGTVNFGAGPIIFAAGDWVVYSGSAWQKSINSNAVASVNGQTGAVVLYTDDISEDGSPTNLWFTDSRARLALSATSPVQYNNSTGVISILDASASQSGVVTTGTQTFAGAKTFSSDLTINSVTAGRGGGGESTSTAFGYQALYSNTYNATSNANTAIGYRALYSTVSASGEGGTNTAVGADTLYANTTGDNNTAIGVNAGRYLTTGSANTLIGMASFFLSTTGLGNTAVGYGAGQSNTSGDFNTYVGYAAAQNYTGGSNNTIIGRFAGTSTTLSGNVIIADGSGNVRFQHDGTNGKLPFLTSNGFVKTSNSDGTLSVDTNTYLTTSSAASTYLPLTGGTLTGPLIGTSATFLNYSGAFIGVIVTTGDTTGSARLRATSTGGNITELVSYSASHASRANQAWIGGDGSSTITVLQAGGVEFMRGSSTGPVTFSSSVTASSASFSSSTYASTVDIRVPVESPETGKVALSIGTSNGGNDILRWFDGATQLGVIKNSGNVGIGTTAPQNPLHIQSNTLSQLNVTALSGNTNAQINLEPTGTGIALIGPANEVDLSFRTNAAIRLTLNGTTGAATFTGQVQSNNSFYVINTPPATNGALINVRDTVTATNVTSFAGVFFNSSPGSDYSIGKLTENNAGFLQIRNANNGNELLRINNTGAATFSSSVTANDAILTKGDWTSTYPVFQLIDTRVSPNRIWNIENGRVAGGLGFYQGFGTSAGTKLYIAEGGFVGIATTSPANRLDVVGDGIRTSENQSTSAFLVLSGNSSEGRITVSSYGSYQPMTFYTGGSERMRITSGGNVGIGTTSPDNGFHVVKDGTQLIGNYYYNTRIQNAGASRGILLGYVNAETTGFIGADQASGNIAFVTNNGTTWGERMRIKSSGDIKIVAGNLLGWSDYVANTSGVGITAVTSPNENMLFYTTGTERMRIDTNGKLIIGASSTTYGTRLGVINSASASPVAHFENSKNTSGDACFYLTLGQNARNTSSYYMQCFDSGQDQLYIYGNGNIVNRNGSYGTISDISLKENIINATAKLNDLLKLKVRNFNLIGDDKKQIGFIAQEFEEVFPSMIDIDGKTNLKLIKTSVLVPILVKAIQEQQAQIEELKSKLN